MEGNADASSTAPLAWHDFLERMRQPSAAEFVKSIKSFIVTFSNRAPDPEKDSAAVQEFLENMEGAFRAHTPWAGSSEEELESAGEGLEKYVMTKLFNRVFASVPEDVKSDEELFEKMSLLQQFIRPENLDIKPEYQNETSWLLAQKELQKINMYKAPRDKLACILNCCKVINNLLLNASIVSNENPPGADEFLPVLIFVTIKVWLASAKEYLFRKIRKRIYVVTCQEYFYTQFPIEDQPPLTCKDKVSMCRCQFGRIDLTSIYVGKISAKCLMKTDALPHWTFSLVTCETLCARCILALFLISFSSSTMAVAIYLIHPLYIWTQWELVLWCSCFRVITFSQDLLEFCLQE